MAARSLGVYRNGGYADRLLVPHPRYLLDIGDMPPERAAPLACSGVTTYGALKKLGSMIVNEPVVIIGAGGLGLMALALLKAMGGVGAIVVDIDAAKREAATTAGAIATVDGAAPDAHKQIIKLTNGGAWSVIDLVGASSTVKIGTECLVKGGKLIVVGLFGGNITISTPTIPLKAMTIQGSYVGSLNELRELIALVQKTGLPSVPIRKQPLAEAGTALEELKAGKVVGRVVLTPN